MMKQRRTFHLYLGCVLGPLLLFFAASVTHRRGTAAGGADPQFMESLMRIRTATTWIGLAAFAAHSPGTIWKYHYDGHTVFHVPRSCCDVPSALYDADGKVICGPDGGFTGKGDGRCADLFERRSEEQKIWDDPRVE